MKKAFCLLLSALMCCAVLYAGGVDNKTNSNPGYERNPSRNTECSRPEAVFYNIGGTAFMEDGLYIEAANQFVFKTYADKMNGMNFEDNNGVFFYPNVEILYKKNRWAVFFGFGVFGGGGELDYKDGTGLTYLALNKGIADVLQSTVVPSLIASGKLSAEQAPAYVKSAAAKMAVHSLNVYSVQLGEIVGASYALNDIVSVAAAGRFMHGEQNITLKCDGIQSVNGGSSKVGYEANGYGFGGIFGMHIKPWKALDIGIQYQTITKLSYEYDDLTGSYASSFIGAEKGESFQNDLPAVLNLGVGYTFFGALNASVSFNYYFNRQARIESPIDRSKYDYGDSWEIACGADYRLNDRLSFGAGLAYSNQGAKSQVNNVFSPVLDSVVAGAGVEFSPSRIVKIAASVMYCNYFDKDYRQSGYTMELSKDVTMAAIGVTVKPF